MEQTTADVLAGLVAPKMIKITVMNRTGHQEVEVDFNGAVDMMKDEISKGKWLRVMTNDGKNYIVTQLEVFNKDLESITQDILNAKSLILMSELKGGGDFRFDAEGYDEQGLDSEGYDREGFDKDGFDANGYDRDGFDADGYDEDGLDPEGNARQVEDLSTSKIVVKVVKDAESSSLIVVTDKEVVFNNAHGKEIFAGGVARLQLAIQKVVPDLMAGKAIVIDDGKKECCGESCKG